MAALGSGTINILKSGAATGTLALQLTGTNTLTNTFGGFSSTTFNGAATPASIDNVSGNNTITSNLTVTSAGGNGIYVRSSGGFLTLSGNVGQTVGTIRGLALGGASDGLVSGNILTGTGGFSVTKDDAGTWTLTGNNTYNGGTTLSGGTLVAGSATALGSTGGISFSGGTLQHSAANTVDYSARFSTAAGQAYKVNTGGQDVTWASNLTSTGGTLSKSGAGTLTLAGINSYSGATTVGGGTLLVNGSLGGTSGVDVAAGATLGGSGGSINAAATVSISGTLAPGASIGMLSLGNAAFQDGSAFSHELNSVTLGADLLNAAGNVSFDGTVTLSLTDLASGALADGTRFTLISYGGTLTGEFDGYADGSTFTLGANQYRINYDDVAGINGGLYANNITLTSIPEPRAALLGGLGILALLRRRR